MAVEALKQRLVRLRVPMGFLLGVTALLLSRPTKMSLLAGVLPAALGVGYRAWAAGHLRKNECLATGGPYAYTRNPLYFGSFLLGLGFAVASGVPVVAAIFILFYLGVYWPVMQTEAEHMRRLFPEQYPAYSRDVPLFWPRFKAWPGGAKSSFDPRLYLRYREYRALIGMVAALATLAAKAYLKF